MSPVQVDLNKLDFSPDPNRDHEIYFHDVLAKATFMPTRNDVLTLSYYTGFDYVASVEDFVVSDSLVTAKQEDFYRQNSKWGNTGLSAKWYRQWRENLHSTALSTFSDYSTQHHLLRNQFELRTPQNFRIIIPRLEFDSQNDIEDFTLRLDNNWQLAESHALDFGWSYTKSKLLFKTINSIYYDDTPQKSQDSSKVQGRLSSVYVEHFWKPNVKASVRLGLRANRYDRRTAVAPRRIHRARQNQRLIGAALVPRIPLHRSFCAEKRLESTPSIPHAVWR
jgi:hypothetical protein